MGQRPNQPKALSEHRDLTHSTTRSRSVEVLASVTRRIVGHIYGGKDFVVGLLCQKLVVYIFVKVIIRIRMSIIILFM